MCGKTARDDGNGPYTGPHACGGKNRLIDESSSDAV